MGLWKRHRLLGQATAILLVAAIITGVEIGAAAYFRNDLRALFVQLDQLNKREEGALVATIYVSDMLNDMSRRADLHHLPDGARLTVWANRIDKIAAVPDVAEVYRQGGPGGTPRMTLEQARQTLAAYAAKMPPGEELITFIDSLQRDLSRLSFNLSVRLGHVLNARMEVGNQYERSGEIYAATLLGVGVLGFALVAFVGVLYFTKMIRLVRQVESRAKDILAGQYGPENGTAGEPREEDGRFGEIGSLRDAIDLLGRAISEREKQMEDFRRRLFDQEKMFTLGCFASGIAHEVGNPIQAIMAITGQVAESLAEDKSPENVERNIRLVGMLAEQAERLYGIVRQVNDFGRPGPTDVEPVDINHLVRATIGLLRFDRRFRTITVTTELSDNLPMVNAVSDHVAQVLVNLLINAADAIDAKPDGNSEHETVVGGAIKVATLGLENGVKVTVSDNGTGMAEEVRQRMLEPFFTTKERGKGTGLGLAVCKAIIVDEHNGTLDVTSAPDQGTTISFVIPMGDRVGKMLEISAA